MIKASVYIICKNEEKHIKRVLEKDFNLTEEELNKLITN